MLDVIQLFKDYRIPYWTEGKNVSPGWVNTKCCFCDDTSNHLGWNRSGKYTTCWKCGVHSVQSAIQHLLRVDWARVNQIIWEYSSDVSGHTQISDKVAKAQHVTPPGKPLTKFHRDYLTNRRFDPDELIHKYHILGTGPFDSWEGIDYKLRVIIPIYFNGEVVSFQGRDITGKQEERYKGCPVEKSVINIKHILYNFDSIKFKKVVVLEGIFDVWRMGSGFVSSFGTTMTPSQINLLSEMDEIIFLFDNEVEAQDKAKVYAKQLASLGKVVHIVDVDTGKDPGEYTDEEVRQVKQELGMEV